MKLSKETLVNLITLLLIWLFLVTFFQPSLLLSKTTTTGGDMGSHYVIAHYLKNYLVPQGKLIGWYPHWMAGTPMLQFYFVPPYLLMVILSYLIPLEIAFKLVTISGIFLLPLTTFLAIKVVGFKFPAPAICASLALPFLFIESYSRYGGNIKSTLAGQFPYVISFSLAILSIALIHRGLKSGKYLAVNSLLFSLVILNHIYTTIAVGMTIFFLFLEAALRKRSNELIYLIKVSAISFLLSGFWLVPMFLKFGFTSAPRDVFYGFPDISQIIIPNFLIFYLLALICLFSPVFVTLAKLILKREKPPLTVSSFFNLDERLSVIYYYFISALLLFLFCNHTQLLYVRFLPLLYFIPLIVAGLAIAQLTSKLKAQTLLPFIVFFCVILYLNPGINEIPLLDKDVRTNPYLSHGIRDVQHWIKWNYEGLERKTNWEVYRELNSYLRSLPSSGRVNVEYSAAYNSFGTPRVFEASPIFSEKSVMESLLLESSITFPFFYYLQKEVSNDAWWPGFPIKMPRFNLTKGAQDLRLYNVKYFVVNSDRVKRAIRDDGNYHFLRKIGQFEVYSLNPDSGYVEALSQEPVLVVTDDWKKFSFQWMPLDYNDVPLVFSTTLGDYELSHFRLVVLDKDITVTNKNILIFNPANLTAALTSSREFAGFCSVVSDLHEEEISIKTDCLQRPLIVKTSYFPNWMVKGAQKIYLASPSVMLIFPEQQEITIYYGTTLPDYLGSLATIIGLVVIVYLLLLNFPSFRPVHKRLTSSLEKSPLTRVVIKLIKRLKKIITAIIRVARENKYKLLVIVMLVVMLYLLWGYLQENQRCHFQCLSSGYSSGKRSYLGTIDSYDLGAAHQQENLGHNLVCQALCDPSRTDSVYVPYGFIEFEMKALPWTPNILTLRLLDTVNCRSGNLYVNGNLITTIKGDGSHGWHDFKFEIATEYLTTDKMKVKLEFDNSECYGWDISDAHVTVPECECQV